MKEAYLCDYIRTPIGRYAGCLSTVRTDELAAVPLNALVARNTKVDWEAVDDVVLGCANQAGEDNRNIARMAVLLAGLPVSISGITLNRLCASGLDAVLVAARAVKSGEADLMIAGGVESMSRAPFVMPKATTAFTRNAEIYDTTIGWRFVNKRLEQQYGIDSMPETAENVASRYAVTRERQDLFALGSQAKTLAAQESGRLSEEITPVPIKARKTSKSSSGDEIVSVDEHPRISTIEKLATLATPFRENGTVTAGNASGVNDGAAALIVASYEAVKRYGLVPKARILAGCAAGVEPAYMGIGPVPATQKLSRAIGIEPKQFDIIELNEAFAAQAIAVLDQLNIDAASDRVNVNGGAIALGHPLGMSGTRLAGTAAMELARSNGKYALVTMCVGVGQGVAVALGQV